MEKEKNKNHSLKLLPFDNYTDFKKEKCEMDILKIKQQNKIDAEDFENLKPLSEKITYKPKTKTTSLKSQSNSNVVSSSSANLKSSINKHDFDSERSFVLDLCFKYGKECANINPLQEKDLETARSDLARVLLKEAPYLKFKDIFGAISDFDFNLGTSSLESYHLSCNERSWIENRYREILNTNLSFEAKKAILEHAAKVETTESALSSIFPGEKIFSSSGTHGYLTAILGISEHGSKVGVNKINIGMQHRGRLALRLCNIDNFDQNISSVLGFYSDKFDDSLSLTSDHIVHQGCVGVFKRYTKANLDGNLRTFTAPKNIALSDDDCDVNVEIMNNPSHLEFIYPVLHGYTKQLQEKSSVPSSILPISIHGDAAFCGQGVVSETLNIVGLKQYNTLGEIGIINNNQIGFSIESHDQRSYKDPTDILLGLNIPILHVNSSDLEACYKAGILCSEFRQKFCKSIYINVIGYRAKGHNEADEPTFTQPLMYNKIKSIEPYSKKYAKNLAEERIIDLSEYDEIIQNQNNLIFNSYSNLNNLPKDLGQKDRKNPQKVSFSVSKEDLISFSSHIQQIINDQTNIHPRIKKSFLEKISLIENNFIDWSFGELFAYYVATNKLEAKVRISGQDSKRGTFAHRHAIIKNLTDESEINIIPKNFTCISSPLSETACLGFEYGHSINNGKNITIWEAQYGDFVNVAQPIIDNFISSGNLKWSQKSNLVMFLPHGVDGHGPEHSSAKIERFLQIGFKDFVKNQKHCLKVVYPISPDVLFFSILNQAQNSNQKPLVVISPKKMLRQRQSFSIIDHQFICKNDEDLRMKNNIDTIPKPKNKKQKTLIISTGQIYYTIKNHLKEKKLLDEACIFPIQTLLPMPDISNIDCFDKIIYCQEESFNDGFMPFISRSIISQAAQKHCIGMQTIKNDNYAQALFYKKICFVAQSPTTTYACSHSHKNNVTESILKCLLDFLQQ